MSRDWNTPPPSGAFSGPREGLPPCYRGLAVFGDSQATWHDMSKCQNPRPVCNHHVVLVGTRFNGPHDGCAQAAALDYTPPVVLECLTDDPAEAQAAFERGAEWVRTGEMA